MPTKLIEVALPLDVINREAAREKSIRHGHPNTLHLWWARRPLAACRAVLFAQLVDDPSAHPELFPTEADQERERRRLFDIIERLVPWEATNNEKILEEAEPKFGAAIPRDHRRSSTRSAVADLSLLRHNDSVSKCAASDLNPVAVLITKALIELPSKFAHRPPVHRDSGTSLQGTKSWRGAQGLAEDVRFYGQWMREEAERRIGHLYPKATLTDGQQATVIAWLWARTVTCPNPACRSAMPLVRSFWLGKKRGRETWVRPVADPTAKRVRFEIGHGKEGPPALRTSQGRGTGFKCLVCTSPASQVYVHEEIDSGRSGVQLMAKVVAGQRGRIYLAPSAEDEEVAAVNVRSMLQTNRRAEHLVVMRKGGAMGFSRSPTTLRIGSLPLCAHLVTSSREAHEHVLIDSNGDTTYADAVATYLRVSCEQRN